jgi:hypothetical protein
VRVKLVGCVSDEISVKRILTALGLSPQEDEKPTLMREARSECRSTMKGREIQASSRQRLRS